MTTRVVSLRMDSTCRPTGHYVPIYRSTQWGNPFIIGRDGDRAECIQKYREMLRANPAMVALAREVLRGRELACWCAPLPCHGDVLAAVAEGEEP